VNVRRFRDLLRNRRLRRFQGRWGLSGSEYCRHNESSCQ
jgi:hypothetical protein